MLRENTWETSQKTKAPPKMMLVEPDTRAGGHVASRAAGRAEAKRAAFPAAPIKLPLLLVPTHLPAAFSRAPGPCGPLCRWDCASERGTRPVLMGLATG